MPSISEIFSAPTLRIPDNPVSDRRTDEEILVSGGAGTQGPQPYPPGVGFRRHIGRELHEGRPIGEGYYDFVRVTDGMIARVLNTDVLVDAGSRALGDDWLKIDLYTSGRQSLIFDGMGQLDLEQRWCNVHLHPHGVDKGEWMAEGHRATGVMLYVHRAFLANCLGDNEGGPPKALIPFLNGHDDRFLFERVPVSSAMARAMNEILAAPYAGGLRRLFLEARCLDILTAVLSAMDGEMEPVAHPLTRRDTTRIEEARLILEQRFDSPPSVVELARKVGLNQQKLKVGFKQVVGMTISGFCQELRLSAAWRLLKETDLSVSQVAYEVGYEFPTNFATAFKRRYGVAPYRFRKGGH